MAKLKNVTDEEILAAVESLWPVEGPDLADITNRLEKGYCDNLTKIPDRIRNLTIVAHQISGLSMALWHQFVLQEQRREIEELKAKQRAS